MKRKKKRTSRKDKRKKYILNNFSKTCTQKGGLEVGLSYDCVSAEPGHPLKLFCQAYFEGLQSVWI